MPMGNHQLFSTNLYTSYKLRELKVTGTSIRALAHTPPHSPPTAHMSSSSNDDMAIDPPDPIHQTEHPVQHDEAMAPVNQFDETVAAVKAWLGTVHARRVGRAWEILREHYIEEPTMPLNTLVVWLINPSENLPLKPRTSRQPSRTHWPVVEITLGCKLTPRYANS